MGEVQRVCCHGATDGTEKGRRIFCRGGTDWAEKYEAQDLSSLNVGCTGGTQGTYLVDAFPAEGCRDEIGQKFCCSAMFLC